MNQADNSALLIIAGPCVIESSDLCMQIGAHVKKVCDKLGLRFVFKASFDKANRSSNTSFRGPGLTDGLVVLERIKRELGVLVLTDIHEPDQAPIAAKVVDILQVPAFLARQTDLLIACAKTGKTVNIKKGQFMSPQEMQNAVEKVRSARPTSNLQPPTSDILLTERGTFFGYNRLVNDFTGLSVMKSFGVPVIFDITHSTQQPAGLGNQSGGNPQYSPLLARAAVATGCVDGLFLECHPDPKNAKSDAATMLALDEVEPLLTACANRETESDMEESARLAACPQDRASRFDMTQHDDDLHDREFPDESDKDESDEPALIECPKCGKTISEDTEWCHHCGWYLSREDAPRKSFWIVAMIVVIIGIFVIWKSQ